MTPHTLLLVLLLEGAGANFSEYRQRSRCDDSALTDVASKIMKEIDQDTRELISTGNWPSSRSWSTNILRLTEEAYITAVQAFRELTTHPGDVQEFAELNAAMTILRPQYTEKRRRLANVTPRENSIAIPFTMCELFERCSREDTPLSSSYLPAIGIIFNTFPTVTGMLADKLRTACDWYNPGVQLGEYAEEMAANHGLDIHSRLHKMNELMRLQVKARIDRVAFSAMSIMFAECWALSQIEQIEKGKSVKSLDSFKAHLTRAVRLIQKKYGTAAILIGEREEL